MEVTSYTQGYYWYYATKDQALNWPIAPGSMLVFMDPDGKHFYVKKMGWSPYDKASFQTFSEEIPVAASVTQAPVEIASEQPTVYEQLQEMREQMAFLTESINRLNQKPQWQNNKKGDNK